MITPVHSSVSLILYFIIGKLGIVEVTLIDLILILSVELIDLDHLFSKPLYHPRRNSFKTHPIHKQWRIVLMIALGLLFIRPVMFIGIGIMNHFLLDFIECKIRKI